MGLDEFKAKYGEEAIEELFFTKILYGTYAQKPWLDYCRKYKIISKGAKYATTSFYEQTHHREMVRDETGRYVFKDFEKPRKVYTFKILNGHGQRIIDLELTEEEHRQYSGE